MKKTTLLALLVPVLLFGCVRFKGPDDVQRQLSRSAGVELQQEVGLTVTR